MVFKLRFLANLQVKGLCCLSCSRLALIEGFIYLFIFIVLLVIFIIISSQNLINEIFVYFKGQLLHFFITKYANLLTIIYYKSFHRTCFFSSLNKELYLEFSIISELFNSNVEDFHGNIWNMLMNLTFCNRFMQSFEGVLSSISIKPIVYNSTWFSWEVALCVIVSKVNIP